MPEVLRLYNPNQSVDKQLLPRNPIQCVYKQLLPDVSRKAQKREPAYAALHTNHLSIKSRALLFLLLVLLLAALIADQLANGQNHRALFAYHALGHCTLRRQLTFYLLKLKSPFPSPYWIQSPAMQMTSFAALLDTLVCSYAGCALPLDVMNLPWQPSQVTTYNPAAWPCFRSPAKTACCIQNDQLPVYRSRHERQAEHCQVICTPT